MSEGNDQDQLLALGRVAGAFGVRGWVKIDPFAEHDSMLGQIKPLWLGREANPTEHQLQSIKPHGAKQFVADIKGEWTREQVAQLRGCNVWARRADFPKADDDEYYWGDLLACEVLTKSGIRLGSVTAVQDHGAEPFLQVDREPGVGDAIQSLIPFVANYIVDVKLDERQIIVDWDPAWD